MAPVIVSTSTTAEGPGQSNADGKGQRADYRMSAAPQPASENSDCICWPPSKRLTDDVRMLYDVLMMLRDGATASDDAGAAEAFGLIADVVRIILRRQSSRN